MGGEDLKSSRSPRGKKPVNASAFLVVSAHSLKLKCRVRRKRETWVKTRGGSFPIQITSNSRSTGFWSPEKPGTVARRSPATAAIAPWGEGGGREGLNPPKRTPLPPI